MNHFSEKILQHGETNPQHLALVDELGTKLTYGELATLARQVACYAQKQQLPMAIPVALPRRVETVAVYLGLNLSGRMFAPLSHTDPLERVNFIADQMDSSVVFDEKLWEQFQQTKEKSEDLGEVTHCPDGCMLIYTSGSTGKPKGVGYTNDALRHAMERNLSAWNYDEDFRSNIASSSTSFPFSAVMMDVFTHLFAGVTLHILGDSVRKNSGKLVDYLVEEGITHCFIPPQMLAAITVPIPTLKQVLTGSERLSNIDPKALGFPLSNLYASSETTVGVTFFPVDKVYDNTPIGKPLPGMEILVLDSQGNSAEEGEIHVAGPISSGYYKMPEATGKAFLPNPFAKGEHDKIMFRTGDLGRRLEDGNILYLNRRDWMAKVDGFRVEPGEIEATLQQLPQIDRAFVKAFVNGKNQTYLCGYYTQHQPITEEEIRQHIQGILPSYMQPKYLLLLDVVPLNVNGKVDRLALKSPEDNLEQIAYAPPETPEETAICNAFAQLLSLEQVGRNDDFFRLGGDSVKTTLLLHRLNYPGLSTIDIMLGKTPAGVAKILASLRGKPQEDSLFQDLPQKMERPSVPLTELQMPQYLSEYQRPNSMENNLGLKYTLDRTMGIDGKTLVKAVDQALANHPGLFSRIIPTDQGVSMIFAGISPICQHITVKEEEIPALHQAFIRRFDFTQGPLCRATVAETEGNIFLWLTVNHIVFDGSSIALLNEELGELLQGQPIQPETISPFALYELEQRTNASPKFQEDQAFFQEKFSNVTTKTMLPWDLIPQEEPEFFLRGTHVMTLSGALGTDVVEAFSKATGISESTLFLAAFGIALAKTTEQQESLFAVATSARTHPQLDLCVAMISKMLPVYITLVEGESSMALLERVQREFHQAMSHDSINMEKIKERCNIETVAQFVYQSDILSGIPHPKGLIPLEMIRNPHGVGSLSFVGLKKSPQFSLVLDYRADLYKEDTIARFATLYEEILAELLQANL